MTSRVAACVLAVLLATAPVQAAHVGHGGGSHGGHGHGGGGWHGGHHPGFVGPYFYDPWFWDPFFFAYAYPTYVPPPDYDVPDAPPPEDDGDQDATYGLVQLRGIPDGTPVDLDGRYWLRAVHLDDRWLALPRGRHVIAIHPEGRDDIERQVDIDAGTNAVVSFDRGR